MGVNASEIACAPRLTVPPDWPLIAAAVEPRAVPVPLALSVVLLLRVNVLEDRAETSNVPPAPIPMFAVVLMDPFPFSASVAPLMNVGPV